MCGGERNSYRSALFEGVADVGHHFVNHASRGFEMQIVEMRDIAWLLFGAADDEGNTQFEFQVISLLGLIA